MTPPNPPSSPSTASLSGAASVGIATLIFRYFLRYFSSTHRTDLSRFRGTFHSFDPVGFDLECIREPGPLERHRRGRLQPTRRPGLQQVIGQLVNWSIGQSVSLGRYRIPA